MTGLMAQALAGLRLLDLSRLLPGPYCSLLFADLGADVIKIEEPGRGDYARQTAPLVGESGIGATFLFLNRNKRSLSVDLKQESGKAVFRRLVQTADVVLESFRPGVMDRLGLGWEQLHVENPRLVFCNIAGFGKDGPAAKYPAYDHIIQGMSGLMSVTGTQASGPLRVAFSR